MSLTNSGQCNTRQKRCGGIDTVRRKSIVSVAAVAVLILGESPVTNIAQAGIFDMMNPSRWFGDRDRDRYRDRDYYWGRGYGYGPGYYGGGWGGPWGYPGGWGGPYWGYPGGWGYPGYYGYPYGVAPTTQHSEKPAPRLPE
jgi:hypothetical protein